MKVEEGDSLVIDCSFVMAVVLPDEQNDVDWLGQYNVYAPTIFHIECANVLRSAWMRKRIQSELFGDCIDILRKLDIIVDNFGTSIECIDTLLKLVMRFNLSIYDASYLERALRLNAKLATLDAKLITVCEAAGVGIVHKIEAKDSLVLA